ncbi:sigma-54 interaction domain-containing protein [Thermoflavimicrobium dichotomicum]|uniref:HTH-type transcriptional regulatory protein TyrR n=1 Tax=Thermoflavimicrobium dichotomicum TaxID=46223 RepID=A0A1I3P5S7_9BACL|nr:sigma 54-interacting transcriptional regulator [Thermoflavimicrobium dichotomicum]SFJ16396.1 PAS domain S-box-containing protein [Thermoflavimicrobium dichotomicum]
MNQLFEFIFQSSYDGIYVADKDGNGLMVNEAYTRITGVKPEELLNKNIRDLVNEGIISESVTLMVLDKKRTHTIIQRVKEKEVLVTGNPVFDENGEILYVVTNVRDISELNQLKLELQKTKALSNQYLYEIEEFKKKESVQMMMDGVVAHSKEIMDVIHLAQKVARVDSTVLIHGESGVGKEVIVNLIHKYSDRAQAPLIKVNCAAIPQHLLESELFGYEKGAFTGADSRGKPGLFEQADGGTIFLDEIGDMPLDLQAKLLRVLQEFEIRRVGGRKNIKIDVRVISATHKNLEMMVQNGQFRQDLFYRLNIVPIKIPPLRERKADIAPLAYYFLNKMNKRYGFNRRFHPEVIYMMEHYDWPGNIREMENLIERLVVTVDHEEIQVSDLPFSLLNQDVRKPISLKSMVEEFERKIIRDYLAKYKTTRKTAKILGISQSALVKKMHRIGLK